MSDQLSFGDLASEPAAIHVPGLVRVEGFLTEAEERACMEHVDAPDAPWLDDLSRRVQHHGYRYDYKRRRSDRSLRVGPLPEWLEALSTRLEADGWFEQRPDQVIINEYQPGQGIAAHVDCVPCFGPTVATISLLSTWVMDMKHPTTGEKVPITAAQRGVVILQGPARTTWTHSFAARQSDRINDRKVPRSRRVSLTFRTMRFDPAA